MKIANHSFAIIVSRSSILSVIGLLTGLTVPLRAQITVEVTSTGMGVGTATPQTNFHVYSGTNIQNRSVVRIENNQPSGTNSGIWFSGGATNANWFIGTNRGDLGMADDAMFIYKVAGNGGPKVVFTDEGRVGVGAMMPTEFLHVNGAGAHMLVTSTNFDLQSGLKIYSRGTNTAARSTVYLENNDEIGGGGTVRIQAALSANSSNVTHLGSSGLNNSLQLFTITSHPLQLGTNNTARMTIDGSGNVGVGTSNPVTTLHIEKANPTILLRDTTGRTFSLSSRWGGYFTIFDEDDTANARLSIGATGNVGIGMTVPAHKLHVAGAVRATSFISDTTTYADFVFKPDYQLPALSEVESHIKERGHLPGIPSEAEAKRDGIDVTKLQIQLLQKVEELTLHLIRLEKENVAQTATIAEQSAFMAEQAKRIQQLELSRASTGSTFIERMP